MTSNDTNSSGRVSTREFYEALLNQNEAMSQMDRRLVKRLDIILSDNAEFKAEQAKSEARLDATDKRIDENVDSIKNVRNLNAFIALLGSTIAGIIGVNK